RFHFTNAPFRWKMSPPWGTWPGAGWFGVTATHQPVTITAIVSPARASAVHMDIRPGWRRWGVARRGGLALAVCVAGLVLPGPAVQGPPRVSEARPGPRRACPPQHGIAAPASEPWAQQ